MDSPEFETWSNNFRIRESQNPPKRVLWIKGSYGTGKTTAMYVHANSERYTLIGT